jgi:excisionase family DNA binding protein
MPPLFQEAQLSIFEQKRNNFSGSSNVNSEPSPGVREPSFAWSINEFCDRFGLGRTTVYEQIKLGRLRARKIGKRTIITHEDVEAWLRNLPSVGVKR